MITRAILLAAVLSVGSTVQSFAQFGVGDRAANDAIMLVNRDADARIANIMASTDPVEVKNAHITIINWNRGQAFQVIDGDHNQCMAGYEAPQRIVDNALTIYTAGINRMLPAGMSHVDVSEILNGRPLGGPGAIVPQVREQILGGDNGTGANILRDPIRCLTFQRNC